MARISGVNIPLNKRVEIGLTYIYGVGRSTSNKLLAELGIEPDRKVRDLTEEEVIRLREAIDSSLTVGERDDRVVEAGLDVRLTDRDVLLDLAAAALGSSRCRHYFLVAFFLPATCMRLGPLRVRALVLVF